MSKRRNRQPKLTDRHHRILALVYPDKTIAYGLTVCSELLRQGLMHSAGHRLALTDAGRAVVEGRNR